uniref:Uncharacterized protein n=1 Tax=Denticeps clupeoides TaxID=299321 RepID=A0AAY4BRR1_9TELE
MQSCVLVTKEHVPVRNRLAQPTDSFRTYSCIFVMVTMFVTILGPSGWILSHLENYKKR